MPFRPFLSAVFGGQNPHMLSCQIQPSLRAQNAWPFARKLLLTDGVDQVSYNRLALTGSGTTWIVWRDS